MNKFIKFSMFVAIVAIATVVGCKRDNSNSLPENMQKMTLSGVVSDLNGNPLSDVKVVTGTETVVTNSDGTFNFKQAEVIGKRLVVRFVKSGYFTVTRSYIKQDDMYFEAALAPKGNSGISLKTTFDATQEKTLEVGGMKVQLPASSVVHHNGSAYNGNVTANMLYLDPVKNKNFCNIMNGGDNMGVGKDGKDALLVSYGMFKLELTDDAGNPLTLKNNANAKAIFPIPEGVEGNLPATLPVSSFDHKKGIWVEKKEASLQRNDAGYSYDLAPLIAPDPDPNDLAPLVDLLPRVSDEDLAPLIPVRTITVVGGVFDCKNKFVPKARVQVSYRPKVNLPSSITTTQFATKIGDGNIWKMDIPENCEVTIRTSANGGEDEATFTSGKLEPGLDFQKAPDLVVPCDDDDDPDYPVEKASVIYENNPNDIYTIVRYGFNGNRRWDHDYLSKSHSITICGNNYSECDYYSSSGWEPGFESCILLGSGYQMIETDSEKSLLKAGYAKQGSMDVAGKTCQLYFRDFSYGGYHKKALWKGIVMYDESDGIVHTRVIAATVDVPDNACDCGDTAIIDPYWIEHP